MEEQAEHETGRHPAGPAEQRAGVSGGALSAVERADLLARYRRLVLTELPHRGAAERWVVRADHCFGRIVLDHAVGACWYDVLDRRRGPAFAQLDDDQLRRAVAVAEQIDAGGDPVLRLLDDQSLAWRGHPPARLGRGRSTRSS